MASKETEVKTASKRTTRKKSTASTKKEAPSVVEGEIVEAAKVKPKRNIVLSDNGDVNLFLINKEDKVTVFVVEQNARLALKSSDDGYVMENGVIVLHDEAQALLKNQKVRAAYLGE